jgi:transcriptional regulator with XRE-family HTH domain
MASQDSGRNPRQVFGAMVRFYREQAGFSRSELARQICKSVSLVQATTLRSFEPLVVPGLLQTDGYARAIFRTRFKITSDEIDERVAARLKRQEVLTRGDPAAFG